MDGTKIREVTYERYLHDYLRVLGCKHRNDKEDSFRLILPQ
jgi:hypothetical protein